VVRALNARVRLLHVIELVKGFAAQVILIEAERTAADTSGRMFPRWTSRWFRLRRSLAVV
jgi:hypothetical protein